MGRRDGWWLGQAVSSQSCQHFTEMSSQDKISKTDHKYQIIMVGKIRDQKSRGSILRVEEKGISKKRWSRNGHRGAVDA